jgi:hypothetical protein
MAATSLGVYPAAVSLVDIAHDEKGPSLVFRPR